jgi:hypothetical protein
MALTDEEREFLSAFVYEATTDPFRGPATDDLHRHGKDYSDIRGLMAAYYREKNPDQEGFGGKKNLAPPPPCPWKSNESAIRRSRELEAESKREAKQTIS